MGVSCRMLQIDRMKISQLTLQMIGMDYGIDRMAGEKYEDWLDRIASALEGSMIEDRQAAVDWLLDTLRSELYKKMN